MNMLMKLAQGSKPGKQANAYKGDNVSYSAKHKRAANNDGSGRKCGNCGSTSNLVWATIHGSNGKQHKTLCKSCHASYDKFDKNINKTSGISNFIKTAALLLKEAQNKPANNVPEVKQPGIQQNKSMQKEFYDPAATFGSNTQPLNIGYGGMLDNEESGYRGPYNSGMGGNKGYMSYRYNQFGNQAQPLS